MKQQLLKITALTAVMLALTIGLITACGGGRGGSSPSPIAQARDFVFTWKPTHLIGRTSGSQVASNAGSFVVNAQSTTSGGGNFSGFCNGVAPSSGRGATVIFGLGRWTSGTCEDAATPDSTVGVTIPQNGQVGSLTVDAVGLGNAANSGQMELKIIHSDGTQTILPITCSLGTSVAGAKVHCEDKTTAHNTNVQTGDQFAARMFYNAGDSYSAIRVNVQYATPTF